MKILSVVSYTIFPARLGGQKGIALFNEYLAKECELVCITVKSNLPQYAKGFKLYNLLSNSRFRYINPLYFFLLKKMIRQELITHLILEHPYYGWLGIWLKKSTGVKIIIHSHNIENTRWKSLGKWWWKILFRYEKWVHRSADYNFFIQEDDMEYAIHNFVLEASKCTSITYGIEWNAPPNKEEKERCKQELKRQYGIAPNASIFLFNGTLDYLPNLQAVKIILERINPILISSELKYKIIICGRGLPAELNQLQEYAGKNIVYAGFVDDITVYFKGADIFINPIIEGGGIKTKLVEAIGYGTPAVSTKNGSIGVKKEDAGDLLVVVPDGDWKEFASQIIAVSRSPLTPTPPQFYQKFYWGNIAHKAITFISQ